MSITDKNIFFIYILVSPERKLTETLVLKYFLGHHLGKDLMSGGKGLTDMS